MKDTSNNAYYFWCSAHEQQRYYESCKHIMNGKDRGVITVEHIYGDCGSAIDRKRCVAMDMRKEEFEAGERIYFTARPEGSTPDKPLRVEEPSKRHAAVDAFSSSKVVSIRSETTKRKQPPKPAKPPSSNVVVGDYAAAINNAISSENEMINKMVDKIAKIRNTNPDLADAMQAKMDRRLGKNKPESKNV